MICETADEDSREALEDLLTPARSKAPAAVETAEFDHLDGDIYEL